MFASAALTCICDVHIKPVVLSTRKPRQTSLAFSSRCEPCHASLAFSSRYDSPYAPGTVIAGENRPRWNLYVHFFVWVIGYYSFVSKNKQEFAEQVFTEQIFRERMFTKRLYSVILWMLSEGWHRVLQIGGFREWVLKADV